LTPAPPMWGLAVGSFICHHGGPAAACRRRGWARTRSSPLRCAALCTSICAAAPTPLRPAPRCTMAAPTTAVGAPQASLKRPSTRCSTARRTPRCGPTPALLASLPSHCPPGRLAGPHPRPADPRIVRARLLRGSLASAPMITARPRRRTQLPTNTTTHKPKLNWLLRKEESVICASLRGAGS
jgi:hypothetical protein